VEFALDLNEPSLLNLLALLHAALRPLGELSISLRIFLLLCDDQGWTKSAPLYNMSSCDMS
jgi:hypothetical protein